MVLGISQTLPEFKANAYVRGASDVQKISNAELKDKWIVIFFYPRDFTFVCPTEIQAFAKLSKEFEREGSTVIGVSTDSYYSHKAWFESDEKLKDVNFPVIADTTHEIAKAFGVLKESEGEAFRGTFIIDTNGVVRHAVVNDMGIGRSVEETLRTLQALRTGKLCPVEWKPGQTTLD
jgi:alkyl hydroperoxide reductase subunit AhpC